MHILKERDLEISALEHHDLLIDGRRVPRSSGRYFDSISPATEEIIGRVAEGGAEDIDAAVRSARGAFERVGAGCRAAIGVGCCWHSPTRSGRMRKSSLNSKAWIQANRSRRFVGRTCQRCSIP